ncbi:hypothetical protein BGW39_001300 [Mortierella sp. 14UC]|nr:hypothetical protein BGW39_001300 [Mortierella sp. 14UC]
MSGLGGLIKIIADLFRNHSVSIGFGVGLVGILATNIQWGITQANDGGHSVAIALTWPKVPGMWEMEGHGPWKDFYDGFGNKEHNDRDIVPKGGYVRTTERLSKDGLVSFNLKHPGTKGKDGSSGVCLNGIIFGFNKDVPVLGGKTLILDTSVMNYIFVDPHKAYDDKGIACIWWGVMDRGGDYLNFNAADLADCKHSTNREGLEEYIKCIQRAIIVTCTTNQGCHKFINLRTTTTSSGGLLKPMKIAESYEDYMRKANETI